MSLALPFILLTTRRMGGLLCLGFSAALAGLAEIAIAREPSAFPPGYHGYLFDAQELLPSLAISLRFLPAFVLGAILARYIREGTDAASARPKSMLMLGILGFVLLSQSSEYIMMLGSIAVVAVAATSSHVAIGLSAQLLRWLGRVSFSLYLTHLPTMLALGLTLDAKLPIFAILILSILISLIVAELFYRGIENPSIHLSRRLVNWHLPTIQKMDRSRDLKLSEKS